MEAHSVALRIILAFLLSLGIVKYGVALDDTDLPSASSAQATLYRGWDYVAEKLRADGISEEELHAVFDDPRMPEFSPVPFKLKPKESSQLYANFTSPQLVHIARDFLKLHATVFIAAEKRLHVSRYIVAAILLVETRCGMITGKHLIVNRLARVASVGAPPNLLHNLTELQTSDPSIELRQVRERAEYLERTFYPELLALFMLQREGKANILELKGSGAGAFGLPQFLPSSYERYALDGDGDGVISLFSVPDAVWSVAYFMSQNGWRDGATPAEKRRVLWAYNRSEAYADAVLKVAIQLRQI